MQTITKIRNSKSNVVGAAYKIAMIEALMEAELTNVERQALGGSQAWWRRHQGEVMELVPLIVARA